MDVSSMHTALTTVKLLRLEVGNLFNTISEGLKEEHGEDGREFINDVQRMINSVHQRYRELEQSVNSIPLATGNLSLQNTSYLSLESSSDKLDLYSPLVRSHKWIEKVHKYSSLGHGILSSNSLRKTLFLSFVYSKRRRIPTNHLLSNTPNWDNILPNLDRMFPDSKMVHKQFPTNVVLHITIDRVLQAMIAFKGLIIEWVVVKGINESCNTSTDLMSESRYNVFRRITDHAHAATLQFSMPNMPEVTLRSYLLILEDYISRPPRGVFWVTLTGFITRTQFDPPWNGIAKSRRGGITERNSNLFRTQFGYKKGWLHSYVTLFTATCKQCGKHSHDCYPPTWRDFRTNDPYHFECKP